MRQIEDKDGIGRILKLTGNQVYHLVRRGDDPLPHLKIGKQLRFDVEKCLAWFDRQPGRDGQDI